MFDKCPKCGQAIIAATPRAEACPACGLVFRKYLQTLAGTPARTLPEAVEPEEERENLFARFLYVPEEVESWRVYAGAALYTISIWMGLRFFAMDIPDWEMGRTFLHTAMVPFHEFGHILFRPFGEFLMLAGGSLAQILMPLGFLALFSLKNRDNFAASLMLWWSGTQWIDLAPYAWDALVPTHVLLTGRTGDTGAHDYIDMLGDLGLLHRAHEVAWLMHKFGFVVMLAAWAWGGYILWRQFQRRAESGAA
jgi:hypothetical protein